MELLNTKTIKLLRSLLNGRLLVLVMYRGGIILVLFLTFFISWSANTVLADNEICFRSWVIKLGYPSWLGLSLLSYDPETAYFSSGQTVYHSIYDIPRYASGAFKITNGVWSDYSSPGGFNYVNVNQDGFDYIDMSNKYSDRTQITRQEVIVLMKNAGISCGDCSEAKRRLVSLCGGNKNVDWATWNNQTCTGGQCKTDPKNNLGLICPTN